MGNFIYFVYLYIRQQRLSLLFVVVSTFDTFADLRFCPAIRSKPLCPAVRPSTCPAVRPSTCPPVLPSTFRDCLQSLFVRLSLCTHKSWTVSGSGRANTVVDRLSPPPPHNRYVHLRGEEVCVCVRRGGGGRPSKKTTAGLSSSAAPRRKATRGFSRSKRPLVLFVF